MVNTTNSKKPNKLKAHLLLLFLNIFTLGTYFGFQSISETLHSLSQFESEIILFPGDYFIFYIAAPLLFHILVAIDLHSPISKYIEKNKYYLIGMPLILILLIPSPFIILNNMESKLEIAGYHYCENIEYRNKYFNTHHVWRAKNKSCN